MASRARRTSSVPARYDWPPSSGAGPDDSSSSRTVAVAPSANTARAASTAAPTTTLPLVANAPTSPILAPTGWQRHPPLSGRPLTSREPRARTVYYALHGHDADCVTMASGQPAPRRRTTQHGRPGQLAIPAGVRTLVLRLANENPSGRWAPAGRS